MSAPPPPTLLVPLAIGVPLATAAVLAGANRHIPGVWRDVIGIGAAVATTVLTAIALAQASHRPIVYWFGGWRPRHGTVIGVDYVVDPMGGGLAVLAGLLAIAALVYSRRYFSDTGGRYPALVLVFSAACVDFAWTGDLFNMFVAFELVAVSGFVLSGYYAESEAPLQGAINFAVVNTLGGLVVLTAAALLYGHTGTLNLAQMGQRLAGHPPGGLTAVAFALLAAGFLIKAGVVPWHFWLPDAYGSAPAPACILFAGVMSELGLFGLARTWETVFAGSVSGPAEARIRLVLGALGVTTALIGTVMSLIESHPRRLLAFVVVAHMGLYLLGFSLLRTAALGGVALLAAADGLTKAALFLAIGVIRRHRRATGGRALSGDGAGVAVAAGLVVVGALGLADLPPFASSVGKDLMVAAAGSAGPLVEVVVAVTVVGSSAAVLVAAARAWLGHGGSADPPAEDNAEEAVGWGQLILLGPPTVLLVAALGLGLVPDLAGHSVRAAAIFVNRPGYVSSVIGGQHTSTVVPVYPVASWRDHLIDLAEAGSAVLLAAGLLVRPPLPAARTMMARGLHRLHAGHIGDQVTWAVLGLAALAGTVGFAMH